MATNYGVISDMHTASIELFPIALEVLKNEGIDALVMNGDIDGDRSGIPTAQYLATVMSLAGKSGIKTYLMPGSHEVVTEFHGLANHFTKQYGNLIYTIEQPKVELPDHQLIFLPGSDWRSGRSVNHGYALDAEQTSGIYRNEGAYIHFTNMRDLEKLVTAPEKTVVFSHVPRRFNSPQTGVDMAEYWNAEDDFDIWVLDTANGPKEIVTIRTDELRQRFREAGSNRVLGRNHVTNGSIIPGPVGQNLLEKGAPIEYRKENRGNVDLAKIFDNLRITKSITGHFHESTGRAHDLEGNPVEDGLYVSQLFFNASCLDRLMIGMVSVNGEKVAYENINLQDYISQ